MMADEGLEHISEAVDGSSLLVAEHCRTVTTVLESRESLVQ